MASSASMIVETWKKTMLHPTLTRRVLVPKSHSLQDRLAVAPHPLQKAILVREALAKQTGTSEDDMFVRVLARTHYTKGRSDVVLVIFANKEVLARASEFCVGPRRLMDSLPLPPVNTKEDPMAAAALEEAHLGALAAALDQIGNKLVLTKLPTWEVGSNEGDLALIKKEPLPESFFADPAALNALSHTPSTATSPPTPWIRRPTSQGPGCESASPSDMHAASSGPCNHRQTTYSGPSSPRNPFNVPGRIINRQGKRTSTRRPIAASSLAPPSPVAEAGSAAV